MGDIHISSSEWHKVLLSLGFEADRSSGKGSHVKYKHPARKSIQKSYNTVNRNFIIIPKKVRHGMDNTFIKELKCFGFTIEDIRSVIGR